MTRIPGKQPHLSHFYQPCIILRCSVHRDRWVCLVTRKYRLHLVNAMLMLMPLLLEERFTKLANSFTTAADSRQPMLECCCSLACLEVARYE